MVSEKRPVHLWAFLQGIGFFPGGWRHPEAQPEAVFTREYYEKISKMAEKACFDAIVYGDQLQGRDAGGRTPGRLAAPTLDPFTLLSAMAGVTENIGLVATVSTTFAEPAEVASKFAALNYVSNGRAGWNIVTTVVPNSAANFGETQLMEKSLRYKRAAAFLHTAEQFWNTAASGQQSALNVENDWFNVSSALPMPTSPQSRPVLVQAGQSADGRDFAAASAEAIFCPAPTIKDGQDYRNDLRLRASEKGRNPDDLLIMPGLAFVLGATEEEAKAKHKYLLELADEEMCAEYLGEALGYNLLQHPIDKPFPIEEICKTCEYPAGMVRGMLASAVETGQTIGAFAREFALKPRGHAIFVGTPEQLAERLENWIDEGACDGFTLQPGFMPTELELFCDHVVPILQSHGRLRKSYEGTTLRDNMGLLSDTVAR